jgi:cytochrome c peroxidase
MRRTEHRPLVFGIRVAALLCSAVTVTVAQQAVGSIGREVAVPRHLADGEEYTTSLGTLLAEGERLFTAVWTSQEGGGRPLTKGTGAPLTDLSTSLTFPRNFNRISGPDANSCAGCHNSPHGIPGGSGDIVSNVFVLGQRFDFATFDGNDPLPTHGASAEDGAPVTLQGIANSRKTIGMFGSGYIEMLARQITEELQSVRDALPPGQSSALVSKGISFGVLTHKVDGTWDTTRIIGLPAPSVATSGPSTPSLIVRPFHQAGAVISLRQFTNNAFNHHHGIQSAERFGIDTDPDGDGFTNELTRADVSAVTLFQATMAVPGRLIPDDPEIEAAVLAGEKTFAAIGCTSCHVPSLPLDRSGWIYTEPNPFNPAGNLRVGEAPAVAVDLSSRDLPLPRLEPANGVVWVPAYTDFKLHDITSGPGDVNREPLDMQATPGSPAFSAGNARFVTRKLWGVANQPPYCHHGLFTTLREAVLAHSGEAARERAAFEALPAHERDCVIEFLKSLQVLPPGTKWLIVNERGRPKVWPPRHST